MLLHGSPYKNVLLAERTKGIFLASLLKRSAQKITVCAEEVKSLKRYPIVEQLNIKKEETEGIVEFQDWKGLLANQGKKDKPRFNNLMMAGNYDFEGILQAV